jgi:hypothetical protein
MDSFKNETFQDHILGLFYFKSERSTMRICHTLVVKIRGPEWYKITTLNPKLKI